MKRLLLSIFVGLLMSRPLSVRAETDPRDDKSPYGVLEFFAWNHDWNQYHYTEDAVLKAAALMEKAGVRFVRMDFLWADIEPKEGIFDFKKYDAIIATLAKHNIKILGILEYNPLWRPGPWNQAPDVKSYCRYARQTVRHFKDRVKYWEIWNEPDSSTYWMPQDGLAAYSELLKTVTPLIKKEDPTALVLLGGLAERIPFQLKKIYRQAGRNSFDIVSIHPFVSPLKPNAANFFKSTIVNVRRVMDENGDLQKPIWITEIGCPGLGKNMHDAGWFLGKCPTEEQQAKWVTTVYETALGLDGVDKIFWAFFRSTSNFFVSGVDDFGLVNKDFSLKPAYKAYQRLALPKEDQTKTNAAPR